MRVGRVAAIAVIAQASIVSTAEIARASDDCADAELVSSNGVVSFDTTAATPSREPFDPSLCAGTFFTGLGADVWYRIDLRGRGTLRLSTCDPDGFDTDLSVHVGPCEGLSMLACNGDVGNDPRCQPRHSTIEVEIEAVGEHLIRIGGFDGAVGVGTLTIEFHPSCLGDLDGDGRVSGGDLGRLFLSWGDCGSCAEDLDGDGRVAGSDLGLLFLAWGECS